MSAKRRRRYQAGMTGISSGNRDGNGTGMISGSLDTGGNVVGEKLVMGHSKDMTICLKDDKADERLVVVVVTDTQRPLERRGTHHCRE